MKLAQYAFGARLAVTGGRDTRIRLLLSAVAVGIGVAMLLLTASVPGMEQHRNARTYVQNDIFHGSATMRPSSRSVLIADASSTFKGEQMRGRVVQPDGPDAPLPPGVSRYPAPGQMAVSPALAELLKQPDGALLRERLPYPVSGTIAPSGLLGPAQLSFVLGSDQLSLATGADRIDYYGEYFPGKPMNPLLFLLSLVGFVVMLAPVGVFLGAAARFGGEQRDRRLAALRLAGADRRMTARIAAGESLAGGSLGLLLGLVFFLIGRQLMEYVSIEGLSFYAQDVNPQPAIAALIVVVIPLLSVAATLLAMRRVAIDPLGVVRRGGARRRRLWWRLLLPLIGAAVLATALRTTSGIQYSQGMALTVVGVVLLLAGVAVLLPWLVEAATRRAPGGGLSWQLAVRRLQLGTGSAAGAVSGIVVAVAGAIALQTLFAGVAASYDPAPRAAAAAPGSPGAPRTAPQFQSVRFAGAADRATQYAAAVRSSPGVRTVAGFSDFYVTSTSDQDQVSSVRVADCATLRTFATLPSCTDGDSFLALGATYNAIALLKGGTTVTAGLGGYGAPAPTWRLPVPTATVHLSGGTDPLTMGAGMLLATPGAVPPPVLRVQDAVLFVAMAPGTADADDQLLTDVGQVSLTAQTVFSDRTQYDHVFVSVTHALVAGAAVTLLIIGLSLLIGQLEQLRERKQALAVLYAVGARRRTLLLSVLWQSALPVALGLLLAVGTGLALGGILLHLSALPIGFDLGGIAAMAGLGGLAVLLVTLLSLPVLLRIMRPDSLRYE
ncbi:ABC transporter permease [Kitasatospora sp. MAP5-34]|uniref:ABC transporter permease n=1 Tax=Kitasatospora sp. MAP5-34 TaxID=3035102 RepID=UPI0024736F65|nr:ABC transporter permease [Kitasatospora sp. MAP5-34]MDH6575914.1 uncharacterized membrane protein YhaH (DUF805 family) [Kitasatospora sp. MAP5-34]